MECALKSTLNFLMRNPIMNNRPSADCGICAKKPYRFPSSVFMLLPLFCDCLHSILPLACYYTINYAVAYVPGSFWDFPAPRRGAVATGIPRPKAVREADALAGVRDPPVVFRGSGLCLCSRWLRPGGGSSLPPADVKDQRPAYGSRHCETPRIIPNPPRPNQARRRCSPFTP